MSSREVGWARVAPLTDEEFTALVDRSSPVTGLVFTLMFWSGLRLSEALAVRSKDFDAAANALRVRGCERVIKVSGHVAVRLVEQITALDASSSGKPRDGTAAGESFVCSSDGLVPIRSAGVQRAFRTAIADIRPGSITPNALRRTFIERAITACGLVQTARHVGLPVQCLLHSRAVVGDQAPSKSERPR